MEFSGLAGRLAQVRETIAARQAAAGWHHPVTIIAITKTHGVEAVRAAFAAGITAVGENRVQEALPKLDASADLPLEWHLVGSLQRNKAKQVAGRFALVHSVDRVELAEELARRTEGGRQRILIQVNCSGEPQKGGVTPAQLPALLDAVQRFDRIEVRGLMTMAEFSADPAVQRAAFRKLRELRDEAGRRGISLPDLSMGMSGDYAVAVEEGATIIRLGTILFGGRNP